VNGNETINHTIIKEKEELGDKIDIIDHIKDEINKKFKEAE